MNKDYVEEKRDMDISGEYKLNPGREIHYGTVRIMDNGYFLFTGDFKLEIDELINQKEEGGKQPYEFLIQTPNGKAGETGKRGGDAKDTAEVQITIHSLQDSVHVKSIGGSGGCGGDGDVGASGGTGGNAVDVYGRGGTGGNGGDGGRGGDGGSGAPAPTVTIEYTPDREEAEVLVLACDNTISPDPLSFGGKGGKKGVGGEKGTGGAGGKNGDGSLADSGKPGNPGEVGSDGTCAKDGVIDIIRKENPAMN